MAPVKRAAGTLIETAEMVAAGALSQPRVTGTGSSRRFSNPWPEWQVCLIELPYTAEVRCTSWRFAFEKIVLAFPGRTKAYLTCLNGPGRGVAVLQLAVL